MLGKIDFTKIKGETVEGQRSFFEQLVCNLARLDGRGGEFRRIEGAGGDGAVEAIRILPSGKKIGYQAKFHSSGDKIDWHKLNNSVQTALTRHPELERYVIALPCDFTGSRAARGGHTDGIWGKWDEWVAKWKSAATAQRITVEIEPWTAFEMENALRKPDSQHLIPFFFDQLVFTQNWIRLHLDRTIHDLQARYSPDEHVDTESLKPFDVIYRRENVRRDLRAIFDAARGSNPRAAAALVEDAAITESDILAVEKLREHFLALGAAVEWKAEMGWPISEWISSWYAFTRSLNSFTRALQNGIGLEKGPSDDALYRRVAETTNLYKLTTPEVFGGPWIRTIPIDGSRAALFVGRAGAGKSHVLARGVETAWKAGAPVIHMLGQHIVDDDPRVSFLKRMEIADWTFHDALSALNLAAEAAGTRGMVVIDVRNALFSALDKLAAIMVQEQKDHVPVREANAVVNSAFSDLVITGQTWLSVLAGADIVRRDVEKSQGEISTWVAPNEVVRFSFQRLQDNLMAERLIKTRTDIDNSFGPGAPFEFLVRRSVEKGTGANLLQLNYHWIGLVSALWTAIAERHGKELIDVPNLFASREDHLYFKEFQSVFSSSVRERSALAFTHRTKAILDWLWEDDQEEKVAILLSKSCVPNHPWNADFLSDRFLRLTLAQRGTAWASCFEKESSKAVVRATEIADWARNVDTKTADLDVVRLAGITITCLLAVTNSTVRDGATKALVNLMLGFPALFPDLMRRFGLVHDPAVLDRLLAACYGAICFDPAKERIQSAAKMIADVIFAAAEPPLAQSTRYWASSIMKRAAEQNLVPTDFEMTQAQFSFRKRSCGFYRLQERTGSDGIGDECRHPSTIAPTLR
jgi:hypothetical protein